MADTKVHDLKIYLGKRYFYRHQVGRCAFCCMCIFTVLPLFCCVVSRSPRRVNKLHADTLSSHHRTWGVPVRVSMNHPPSVGFRETATTRSCSVKSGSSTNLTRRRPTHTRA
jgi:hypothetical protein